MAGKGVHVELCHEGLAVLVRQGLGSVVEGFLGTGGLAGCEEQGKPQNEDQADNVFAHGNFYLVSATRPKDMMFADCVRSSFDGPLGPGAV